MAKPRCFFDITIGGKPAGRVVMEVSIYSQGLCISHFVLFVTLGVAWSAVGLIGTCNAEFVSSEA